MNALPYGKQSVDEADIAAVVEVLRSAYLTTGGAVTTFERALAEQCNAAEAVACSSGTAGLHLAARLLKLEPGDIVIVPSITFVATANVVRMVGGEVWFADVDPNTGLMGAGELEDALDCAGNRVQAVFPVHLAGQSADMEAIAKVCEKRGLSLIEDACHAIGTTATDAAGEVYPVGACRFSEAAVFSFHPVKTITTGEGGAILTNNKGAANRLRQLRSHGLMRNPNSLLGYEMHEIGFNYRCTDIQCALGLSQLRKLEHFAHRRRELVARYDAALADWPDLQPLSRISNCDPCWHLYIALIDFDFHFPRRGLDRVTLMRKLGEKGIRTQVHYIPVHLQPYYQERYGPIYLPGAESYYSRCLSLPLFPTMENADVDRVVSALLEIKSTDW